MICYNWKVSDMLVCKPYNHIDSKKEFSISRPDGQAAKTPPFHGGNGGSIPPRVTRKKSELGAKSTPSSFFWNRNTHLKVTIFLDRIGGQAPGAKSAPGAFFNPTKYASIKVFCFLYAKQIWYRKSDAWHSCTKHAFCKKSPDISYIAWTPAIVHNIDISLSLWFFCHLSFSVPLQRGT